jgi:single-strand DNA-binding protein
VNAWRDLAEHVAESAGKGATVIVTGRLRQRSYETREGEQRTVFEIEASDVGISVQRATVKITKTERSNSNSNGGGFDGAPDEPPF